jgi:hypothetical protein
LAAFARSNEGNAPEERFRLRVAGGFSSRAGTFGVAGIAAVERALPGLELPGLELPGLELSGLALPGLAAFGFA